MEGLSPLHLIIVLVIALLVLGPGKLPEVGAALGKMIREFRKAATDMQDSARLAAPPAQPPAAPPAPVLVTALTVAPVAPAAPLVPAEPTIADPVPPAHP